jgi:hypothetical protein
MTWQDQEASRRRERWNQLLAEMWQPKKESETRMSWEEHQRLLTGLEPGPAPKPKKRKRKGNRKPQLKAIPAWQRQKLADPEPKPKKRKRKRKSRTYNPDDYDRRGLYKKYHATVYEGGSPGLVQQHK